MCENHWITRPNGRRWIFSDSGVYQRRATVFARTGYRRLARRVLPVRARRRLSALYGNVNNVRW